MPFALITDRTTIEWADLGVLAALFVVYLLLAIPFPGLVLRPLFWLATRTIYRIRVTGQENVPPTGPALLLSNHVTFIDWLLIWHACPRKVRFVAWAGWMTNPIFRWFLKASNSILVYGEGGPKQLVKSLKQITAALDAGEVVCLFPEGALSRGGGAMLPFRRGFERVLQSAKQPVPVIPMYLSQLWGSIFSYAKGKVLWKWPQRIPYRVTVAFGKPLPPTITAPEVRLAVQELSADVTIRESDHLRPVHRQFVRTAARFSNLRRTVWVDASAGKPREISYFKALVGAMCIARWLAPRIGTEPNVGIWLPTSAGSALANIALNFLGRTTVNLNYTSGTDAVRSAIKQTGMKTIVTSKRFLDRMPLEAEGINIIHLEDAQAGITKWQRIRSAIAVAVLPGWVLEHLVLRPGPPQAGRRGDDHLLQRQHRRAEGDSADVPERVEQHGVRGRSHHAGSRRSAARCTPVLPQFRLHSNPVAAAADRCFRGSVSGPAAGQGDRRTLPHVPLHGATEHGHVSSLLPASLRPGGLSHDADHRLRRRAAAAGPGQGVRGEVRRAADGGVRLHGAVPDRRGQRAGRGRERRQADPQQDRHGRPSDSRCRLPRRGSRKRTSHCRSVPKGCCWSRART